MIISLKRLEELLAQAYDHGFDAGRTDGLYEGHNRGFDKAVDLCKEVIEDGQSQSDVRE